MGPRKIPMATHNNELLIVYPQGNAVESKDRDNKLKLCANSSLIQMNCISLKPPAHINNNAKHEEEEELYLTITHTSLAVSHSRETMGGKRVISPCHVLLYLCGVHMACVATQKHLRDHGCCWWCRAPLRYIRWFNYPSCRSLLSNSLNLHWTARWCICRGW